MRSSSDSDNDVSSVGGRRTRRPSDPDRGARILTAAARLFFERGYHAVTVDQIGEAAGATGAAIYRHYEGKEELLSTLFDQAQDRFLLAVPDLGDDPLADVAGLVDRHLTIMMEQRDLGAIWANERRALSPAAERRMNARSLEYLQQWARILGRAFPRRNEHELISAANIAIGTATSLIGQPRRAIDDRELALARQMILAGLHSLRHLALDQPLEEA